MIPRLLIAIFILFLGYGTVSGQTALMLASLAKELQKGKTDSIRIAANEEFRIAFKAYLENNASVPGDSLPNVSAVEADDNTFRIYTWVLPYTTGEYRYFGYLRLSANDSVIELIDSTELVRRPESEKLSPQKWYGMIYYHIITRKKKGTKYYTLLGWKGKNRKVTEKGIDVLHFDKGRPRFGHSIFRMGSVYRSRILFSFNAQSAMTLRYDENYGGIVFDHLSPLNPEGELAADGRYDGLKWKKGRWQLYRDIDVGMKMPPAPDSQQKNTKFFD